METITQFKIFRDIFERRNSFAMMAVLIFLCQAAEYGSKARLQVCVFDKYVGRREGDFCFVDMVNQEERRTSLEKAAENCRSSNGTIVTGSEAPTTYATELSRLVVGPERYREDHDFPDKECANNPDSCRLMCKLSVCPLGFFDPPSCRQICHCKQMDFCDAATGDCMNEECYAGFHNPPLCLQPCNCLDDVSCNAKTGRCHLGCKPGWTGEECRTRMCPAGRAWPPACLLDCHCFGNEECNVLDGKCEHGCESGWSGTTCSEKCVDGVCLQGCFCSNRSCKDPPGKCLCDFGWTGKYCSERKCQFGTFGPPSCSRTCFCENDRFCNPSNGDCMGTPCKGNHKGRDCQGNSCPQGYFSPPNCDLLCFCANGTECDSNTGNCPNGCADGWQGRFCNTRLCPKGTHSLPACNRECHCKVPAACNSRTGACERGTCSVGWSGFYCNISLIDRRSVAAYSFQSSPSYIMGPLAIILVVITVLVIMSLCTNRVKHREWISLEKEQSSQMDNPN